MALGVDTVNNSESGAAKQYPPSVYTNNNNNNYNIKCKVCGQKASGFHFGVFACPGCKSFFGRMCNRPNKLSSNSAGLLCRNGGACIISPGTRRWCRVCRLKQCHLVGMSKSASRHGRRSNWQKAQYLLIKDDNTGSSLDHQEQTFTDDLTRSELHHRHHQLRNDHSSSDDQDPIDLSPASLLHRPSLNNSKLKSILRSQILDKLQRQQHDFTGMSGIPGDILKDDAIITPLDLSGR